jgi:hypothetical protein
MRGRKGSRKLEEKTIPQLQNTLWDVFAKYIKTLHAPQCYTCDKPIRMGTGDCQAGHFIPRNYSPTKYEEDNVRPQCSRCNQYFSGKPVEFERRLRDEIGDEAVEALKRKSTQPWKWSRTYLITKITYYREQLKEAG